KCSVSMERIEEMHREIEENPEIFGNKIPNIKEAEKCESFSVGSAQARGFPRPRTQHATYFGNHEERFTLI
ncbi:MAG: hypothetical protein ACEQSL_06290, partial [Sediminibacterium sp.]